jgi:hypothetical protein
MGGNRNLLGRSSGRRPKSTRTACRSQDVFSRATFLHEFECQQRMFSGDGSSSIPTGILHLRSSPVHAVAPIAHPRTTPSERRSRHSRVHHFRT